VSRILLVTQSARSAGEFRRPWVRALHRHYVARYRRQVARAASTLAGEGELIVLAARELVAPEALPPGVELRYYDEESFKVDSNELAEVARHLEAHCWPSPEREPELSYRGVWLPDVLAIARGLVLRMEVAEPLGAVERVWYDIKPDRLVLLSDASMPERAACLLARRDGRPMSVAAPAFLWSRVYDAGYRALFPREERLRVQNFLRCPRRATPRSAAGNPRFLFVTCRPRHHFVVDPLVTAVRAAGGEAHIVATPTTERALMSHLESLGRTGMPWSYLSDFLPRRDALALVRRYRPVFGRMWRRMEHDPGFARGLDWHGLPLLELARPLLRDSVERSLLAAVLFQEAAFRAVEALRPDTVVITSNRRHAERALALAARAAGVPCLLFSGALVMGRERSRLFDVGDRMLVIGEHLKERLVAEQGVAASLISVVGDPRSNAARLVPPTELRRQVFADFGLAPAKPLLVFLSKYVSLLFSPQEKEAYYRTMIGALPALGHPNVVVKVHPNENLSLLSEQVRRWGWPEAILTKEYDIHRLLAAADAAVMVTSMAGLEAMALDCPVVSVQATGKDYEGEFMPPYVSEGVVERVDMEDSAALAAALKRLTGDPDRRQALVERGRKFAARYVHPVDGGLGERLLAVVNEVRGELAGGRTR